MKKPLFLLIVLISFTSCKFINDTYVDNVLEDSIANTELTYPPEWRYITTEYQIYIWISLNLTYGDQSSWLDPATVIKNGVANCKGYTVVYMNMMYVCLGKTPSLAIVYVPDRSIVEGGDYNHSLAYRDGELYEPQIGRTVDYKIAFIYSFWEVF